MTMQGLSPVRSCRANPYPTESQEQAALFEWAQRMEGRMPELSMLHAIPNGEYRTKRTGALLKRTGVKRGVPDICLPVARRGCHGLYIELKRVKGSHISREQLQWMDALARQGYQCAICKGWEMARDVIVDYLQGKGDTP